MSRRLVLIALMLPLAACGGSESSATSAVRSAVNMTLGASSVRETVSSRTPTASGSSNSSATGTYSFASHLGAFTVTTDAFLGTFEVVLSGSVLYLRLPGALVLAAKGRAWASADLTNPPAVPGSGNLTSLAGAADPSRVLTGLRDGVVSATKVGTSTVNGAATIQYIAKVTFSKAKSALATSEETLVGGPTATDDVYVGSDGRLARLVSRVDLKGGGVETLSIDFSSYGAAAAAHVPPPDRVVPGAELLGQ